MCWEVLCAGVRWDLMGCYCLLAAMLSSPDDRLRWSNCAEDYWREKLVAH